MTYAGSVDCSLRKMSRLSNASLPYGMIIDYYLFRITASTEYWDWDLWSFCGRGDGDSGNYNNSSGNY